MIRGLIFDLGNTLLHFEGNWNDVLEESWQLLAEHLLEEGYDFKKNSFTFAFKELFESRVYERTVDHIEQQTTELFRAVMTQFGYSQLSEDFIEKSLERFYSISEAHWTARASVNLVVDELRAEGYQLGLISNAGDEPNVMRLLEKGDLREYFEPALVSATEGIRKPHVEIFQKVLRQWGLSSRQVVMIGDSLGEDILGAQKAGIHQIWMREHVDTLENNELAKRIRPEAVAKSFQEIPSLIRTMNGEG